MNHFNVKSLAFYGTAIGSVAVLFQVVTAYGEANLKAPPTITGRYRLQTESLPKCLQSEPLILNVEQSGIYVNAALLPEKILTSSEEKLSLSGLFATPELTLSGAISQLSACYPSENTANNLVTIQANWEKEKLTGTLTLNSSQKVVNFTAQKEVEEKPSKQTH